MLDTLWVYFLIVGVILLIVALFLMLFWKVIGLIDELSGRKARRQIKKLREINKANGEMTSVSTGDLELMLGGSGSLIDEPVTKVETDGTGKRSLRSMIDDPYGSVGKNAVKPAKQEYVIESGVSDLLHDVESGIESKKSIIILDEQSSL